MSLSIVPRIGALVVGAVLLSGAASASVRGAGRNVGPFVPAAGPRLVYGESLSVPSGGTAFTWARVNVQGRVQEVGVSVPAQLIWSPDHGPGPLGAFLSLDFPEEVQATTYFNHFEAHWNPEGHPPDVYGAPHFDLHFYSIPESAVWGIMGPDTQAPSLDQIPAGYIYPGVNEAVPMMGVHAVDPNDFTHEFTATMVAGFWHGAMTFVEPMVTREYLMNHPNFALPVPRPLYLYRSTQYPAVFRSHYNARTRAYEFTYTGFSNISAPPVS